jgi:hypothetical protein
MLFETVGLGGSSVVEYFPSMCKTLGPIRSTTKEKKSSLKKKEKPRLVVHTCNPSYSGGRGQENPGMKPP